MHVIVPFGAFNPYRHTSRACLHAHAVAIAIKLIPTLLQLFCLETLAVLESLDRRIGLLVQCLAALQLARCVMIQSPTNAKPVAIPGQRKVLVSQR